MNAGTAEDGTSRGGEGSGATQAPVDPAGNRPDRPRAPRPDVDPEDWAASTGSNDDRLLHERPPHW